MMAKKADWGEAGETTALQGEMSGRYHVLGSYGAHLPSPSSHKTKDANLSGVRSIDQGGCIFKTQQSKSWEQSELPLISTY